MRNRLLLCLFVLSTNSGIAAVLDPESPENRVLESLHTALDEAHIDVAKNLNSRAVIGLEFVQPRLGAFPDLPIDTLPDSDEIAAWEGEYQAGNIAAIVFSAEHTESLHEGSEPFIYEDFLQSWFGLDAQERVFITIYKDDFEWNEKLLSAIASQGHVARQFRAHPEKSALLDEHARSIQVAQVGRLYATAGQRWGLDSKAARRARTSVKEVALLGEKIRRNSSFVFSGDNRNNRRIARREPSVFQKIRLGDEFEASTIEEVIVPGGIALGEKAKLDVPARQLRFTYGKFRLWGDDGQNWSLPPEQEKTLKSLFDFSQRAEKINSDAIVDIDEKGEVKISAALRDTDVGYDMVRIDDQPFTHIKSLPARKSVIIDASVSFFESSASKVDFKSVYEVRFLRADSMRVAQTTVALVFEFDSLETASRHVDSWGYDLFRLHEPMDFEDLGKDTAALARYAAWVALFRTVSAGELPFLRGRYEFMKIDKSGRSTPRRIL